MIKKYSTRREFPLNEYKSRFEKARKLMEKQEIDALLLTQRENVEYYSGFLTHLWDTKYRPFVAIFPRDADPVLVLPTIVRVCAERTSWVKDIRVWRDPGNGVDRAICAETVVDTIRDMGLAKSIIGIESGYDFRIGMPLRDLEVIRSNLAEAKFVDAWNVIWSCRMVKSSLECAKIKKATEITCGSIRSVFDCMKSGMTEQDVARDLCTTFLDKGADEIGFINVRVANDPWRGPMADSFAYDRKIKSGDLILADVGAKYGGYFSDITRMAFVNDPPEEINKMYRAATNATDTAIAAIMPGVRICDVFKSGVDALKKGYGEVPPIDRIGHGLGMDMHEPPNVGPKATDLLKPGMIFAIEPLISKHGITTFAEDDVCVTETGCENYSNITKDLWIVH